MTPEMMEGMVSAAKLVALMVFLVNAKLLTDYIGVGAIRKALRDIVDGSYSNLLTHEQRVPAIAALREPFPAVVRLFLGVEHMAAYVQRLLTSAGFPGLLDSLQHTSDVWPAEEEALA
jgi:hypothetical protein